MEIVEQIRFSRLERRVLQDIASRVLHFLDNENVEDVEKCVNCLNNEVSFSLSRVKTLIRFLAKAIIKCQDELSGWRKTQEQVRYIKSNQRTDDGKTHPGDSRVGLFIDDEIACDLVIELLDDALTDFGRAYLMLFRALQQFRVSVVGRQLSDEDSESSSLGSILHSPTESNFSQEEIRDMMDHEREQLKRIAREK